MLKTKKSHIVQVKHRFDSCNKIIEGRDILLVFKINRNNTEVNENPIKICSCYIIIYIYIYIKLRHSIMLG